MRERERERHTGQVSTGKQPDREDRGRVVRDDTVSTRSSAASIPNGDTKNEHAGCAAQGASVWLRLRVF